MRIVVLRAVCFVGVLCLGCNPDQKFALLVDESSDGEEEVGSPAPEPEPEPDAHPDEPWELVLVPREFPRAPETPDPDEEEDTESLDVSMMIEAVLQRNSWGDEIGRCQVQVAFMLPQLVSETDLDSAPPRIELPEDTDRCQYSDLVLDPSSDDEVIDDPPPETDPDGDDWFLAGDLAGAEEIYLHTWDETLVLKRYELFAGEVRYQIELCDETTFPFGQVFDLEVPYLEDGAIPGFYVDNALAVGHDVEVTAPIPSEVTDAYYHQQEEAISYEWEDLGAAPVVGEETLEAQRMIFARNHVDGEHVPFEALACRPPGVGMVLPSENVEQLLSNPDVDTELYYMALQIDTVYETPSFVAPWGQIVMARSTVSESGEVHLYTVE